MKEEIKEGKIEKGWQSIWQTVWEERPADRVTCQSSIGLLN